MKSKQWGGEVANQQSSLETPWVSPSGVELWSWAQAEKPSVQSHANDQNLNSCHLPEWQIPNKPQADPVIHKFIFVKIFISVNSETFAHSLVWPQFCHQHCQTTVTYTLPIINCVPRFISQELKSRTTCPSLAWKKEHQSQMPFEKRVTQ